MSSSNVEVAVIIVNYGTADLSIAAVESVLERSHGGRRVVVHLLDNASPGNDAQRFMEIHDSRDWGDRVALHFEKENRGFGHGNNVVLAEILACEAAPGKVFLLNPDARLANEAIAVLAQFLDEHPGVGAAGAAISLPDGTAVTSAFRFPSIASEFERTVNFGPVSRVLKRARVPLPPATPTRQVDWVSGAAVMFRSAALRQAGLFDPAYFLYYEEVDLMRRLLRLGWQSWIVADAHVVHEEGAATGVASATRRRELPEYVYRSWCHYFSKNHGAVYAAAAASAGVVGGTLNLLICWLRQRPPQLPLHYRRHVLRYILWPLVQGAEARAGANTEGRAPLR
jgi:N-acetylglucosaminyl-diphospho-decaprenol L-rhamnosyltransferase